MVDANQTWALWAALLVITATGLWAERLRWGARVSAVIITVLLAMLLSNTGVIPNQAEAYDVIRTYLVPLAIPMLILKADLMHGWRDLALTAGALLLSIAGAIIGVVIVYQLLPADMDQAAWARLALSGHIGGSQAVVNLEGVNRSVHSVLLTLYIVLLFLLPSFRALRQFFHEPIPDNRWGSTVEILITEHRKGNRLYLPSITITLAISTMIGAFTYQLAPRIGLGGVELLIIATVSLGLALALPKRIVELSGAEDIGILIMLLFFAILGANADLVSAWQHRELLGLGALVLLIQTVILLGFGKLARLSLPQLVIAANASIGGPASTTAMAAARRWHTLLFPAILYATLGQLVAEPIAHQIGSWLG